MVEIFGPPTPPDFAGRSLVPLFSGDGAGDHRSPVSQHGRTAPLVRHPWKLIQPSQRLAPEHHRLDRDPGEQDDLAFREPERVVEMQRHLWVLSQGATAAPVNPTEVLDDETRSRLRELRYIE